MEKGSEFMDTNSAVAYRSVVERVVEELAYEIRMGIRKPGDKLPSERKLCENFGASRNSVREALKILSSRRLIQIQVGRGSFITDFAAPGNEPVQLLWEKNNDVPLDKLLEFRLAIEPEIAALAARRIDEKRLRELEKTLENLRESIKEDNLSDRVFSDIAFHDCLVRASENPLHVSVYRSVEPMLFDIRRIGLKLPERSRQVLEMHEEIYEAVKAKEADAAARAMRDHILRFARDMGIALDPVADPG
jgi:GntR family transcriptional repressor for pyruvate dehydrogenase complex